MKSADLIKAGRLTEARSQLTEEVKASPADTGKRTLLFQVLLFQGEWQKAERHLDIVAGQVLGGEAGVQAYKNLLAAEKERIEVLRHNQRPSFLPEAPPYVESYLSGCAKLAEKKADEAQRFFDQALSGRPPISGTLNGKAFVGFEDTDTVLAAFLEAFVHDRYTWIPFESLRELSIPAPNTLFDLIWTSAGITTWEGLSLNCYLPVLYPESFLHEDERIRFGRMTDWIPLGNGSAKGMGQHVFQVGEEDVAILEIREVLFDYHDTEKHNG